MSGTARNLPRRFYKTVGVRGDAAPYAVVLDERPIKTPMKAELTMPTRALAAAVAGEWQDQAEVIDPLTMPLTRLCNTAIDRVAGDPDRIVDEIAGFAASDLLCYRADSPEGLVARQAAAWDPLLENMRRSLGARFIAVAGLMHHDQPASALHAVADYLSGQTALGLTAIHNMATLTGSCIISINLYRGEITGEDAWSAAHVDEDWQIENWGEDDDAKVRQAANKREFNAALQLLDLLDIG